MFSLCMVISPVPTPLYAETSGPVVLLDAKFFLGSPNSGAKLMAPLLYSKPGEQSHLANPSVPVCIFHLSSAKMSLELAGRGSFQSLYLPKRLFAFFPAGLLLLACDIREQRLMPSPTLG